LSGASKDLEGAELVVLSNDGVVLTGRAGGARMRGEEGGLRIGEVGRGSGVAVGDAGGVRRL